MKLANILPKDSETQERGLQVVLTKKCKTFPVGACPPTPLEACALGARLGNRSVFILDPRQKLYNVINKNQSYLAVLSFDLTLQSV